MANWKYFLNVKDEWKLLDKNEMELKDFIKVVIQKLKGFSFTGSELLNIIDDFEVLAEQDDPEIESFDCIWNDLYNWADQEVAPFGKYPRNKMMWIETS